MTRFQLTLFLLKDLNNQRKILKFFFGYSNLSIEKASIEILSYGWTFLTASNTFCIFSFGHSISILTSSSLLSSLTFPIVGSAPGKGYQVPCPSVINAQCVYLPTVPAPACDAVCIICSTIFSSLGQNTKNLYIL